MTNDARTHAEFLAAGTDLLERRRSGVSAGPVAQLPANAVDKRCDWLPDGTLHLGAGVTIAALGANTLVSQHYPGLAAAANGLATPEIRKAATLGGNLAQRTRCWYFRNPHVSCLKKGGSTCPAREGNHLYGAIFDVGPCVAPHPSTLATALLAYDAIITTTTRAAVPIADLYGDGSDGRRDHRLADSEAITAVTLPAPTVGERAVYDRRIARAAAEWPLVEAVVRIAKTGNQVSLARIAVGGVAAVPLRLHAVEQALEGHILDQTAIAAAARAAVADARPLPMTTYKVQLLETLITDLLARVVRPTT